MASTPASSFHPSTAPRRPSRRAIAFASSIVLSKPEDLTVKEYIDLLRQHIAKGRRENALSSVYRHLDRSSYWRAECERVAALRKTAEDTAVDLQRQIDSLKARLDTLKPVETVKASATKRKKRDEDVVPVPRSPAKRTRQQALPLVRAGDESASGDVEASLTDMEFERYGIDGHALTRCLHQVHTMLRRRGTPNQMHLAYHLAQAAEVLPKVIRHSICGPCIDPVELQSTVNAAARAAAFLIVGLNKLGCTQEGRPLAGRVIYVYVKMFAHLLETFDKLSAREITKLSNHLPPIASGTGRIAEKLTKSKGKQAAAPNIKAFPTLDALTSLLCGIIDILDPKLEGHQALFEGFAYASLNKLGDRLYGAVFGTARAETLEGQIAMDVPASGSGFEATPTTLVNDDEMIVRVRTESPYLVHLLNRLMRVAPAFLGSNADAKTAKQNKGTSQRSMKGTLAITAKDRLQRTLINALFGMEGVDESDPFMDCLKMPGISGPPLPIPKVKETDAREWLTGEVWRLLGWEILRRESVL